MTSSSPASVSLSVIFVTFNSADKISAAVSSVRDHLPNPQIIVVDNGSTDQTCQVVDEMLAVRLIQGHGNVGFGAGVNLGARAATSDLLLVLNPDTIVIHADTERLLDLTRRPPVGMLGCLVHEEGKSRYLRHTEWGWRRELSWVMMQWFLLPREMTVRRPHLRAGKGRLWISGATFVVSRSEFWSVGGFDEDIFLYFEDMDLSRRYRQHGAGVGTTDAIVITHKGQGSWSSHNQEQIQSWELLSLLQLVAKWRGRREGERAARAVVHLLSGVSLVGRVAGYLPFIGLRAQRKGRSADLVKLKLLANMDSPPVDGVYTRARIVLSAIVKDRGVSG